MPSAGILTPERPAQGRRRSHPRDDLASYSSPPGEARLLARFRTDGADRHVLALDRPDGSVLVLDCRAGGLTDARVIGRIAREEPRGNASLLAGIYVADERRGRPRALCPEDLDASPPPRSGERVECSHSTEPLIDAERNRYSLRPMKGASFAELRWTCTPPGGPGARSPVSLRGAVGALENYEPAVTLTEAALSTPAADVSIRTLQAELERLRRSPIVLNRGLREAVARRIAAGATLSEIALRCGRFKHDRRGNRSGETSWLARRIGQLPESCQPRPTPWIHSNTLALIAREGLCMSPHEVEL